MSQPALSKTLSLLEAELGVQLLIRSPSGICATPSGNILYEYAKTISVELQSAADDLRRLSQSTEAIMTIGAVPSLMSEIMGPATLLWREQFPDQPIRVVEHHHVDLVAGLMRGTFDFIMCRWDPARTDKNLVQRRLFRDRFCVVARTAHPLIDLKTVTIDDLGMYPWIFASIHRIDRPLLEQMFIEAGADVPRARIECDSLQYIISLVRRGNHLAILPRHAIVEEIRSGVLETLEYDSKCLAREIALLHRVNRPLSAAAEALISHVRDAGLRASVDGIRPR
jgi:DNA-binding transcriptional LysR family regulator